MNRGRRFGLRLAFLSLLVFAGLLQLGYGQNPEQNPATNPDQSSRANRPRSATPQTPASGESNETELPIPPESKIETKHDWTAGSRTVHYTATAGNLLIKDENDKAIGSMFYVAYTEDGVPARAVPSPSSTTAAPGLPPSGCTWARSAPCA